VGSIVILLGENETCDDKKAHTSELEPLSRISDHSYQNMQSWFCPPPHRGLPETYKPSKQQSVFPVSNKDEHGTENKNAHHWALFGSKSPKNLTKAT
jgi:hypothetical protein